MRDKPSFDDLEAKAAPQSRFRGLTDSEWAARVERRERTFRALCGVIFGFVVGVLGVWPWLSALRTQLPALPVIGGSMLGFAALFARRRDEEAMGLAGWIMLPEWKVGQAVPWWAFAVAWLMGAAACVLVTAIGWALFSLGRASARR